MERSDELQFVARRTTGCQPVIGEQQTHRLAACGTQLDQLKFAGHPTMPPQVPDNTFDLIIIGAGINGSGIARDAAMRGLKVLLLDKGDVGSGTSSWSTRLIHGGLRYLEYGEFGLVRESLREREILFHIAPHLVKPLPILIPLYKGARRGPWTIRAGMLVYDTLSLGKSLPGHRMITRAAALERAPGLNSEGLSGAALYYDAQVEFAERLVLENALAAKDHGATVMTYVRVDKFLIESDVVTGVEIKDLLSDESHSVRGRMTINAAGPWVDEIVSTLDAKRMIGGTKGSHIIVAPFAGAPVTALYVEARADRRPFFIIPWNTNFLIGTTDKRYDGDLDAVEIEDQEIEYLLTEANRVIPNANLSRDAILFTYSGVRPLAFTANNDEQSITRRAFIHDHAPELKNLLSIVGGKLTTYRSLAEQAVNLVFKKLRLHSPPCTTQEASLPGAVAPDFASFCKRFKAESGLPEPGSERLLRIYGTRASELLRLGAENPALREPLKGATRSDETGAIAAEVVFSCQHELARTLTDCLLRRTMLGLSSSAGIGEDEAAAKVAQQYLGWTDDRVRREVETYRRYVGKFHPRSLDAGQTPAGDR
jgi:glycerol-3-phosphate dehydrogenase